MGETVGSLKLMPNEVDDVPAEVDEVVELLRAASLYTLTELILQYL